MLCKCKGMAWKPALVGGIAALLVARELFLNMKKKRATSDDDEDEVDYKFLTVAAKEAETAMRKEEGGPFGAVIVRNGEIVAQAHNEVLKQKDPTAHAEILAIQKVPNACYHDEIVCFCRPNCICMESLRLH